MTKRESILLAIEAILDDLDEVDPASVFRSRVSAFLKAEAPAVLLTWLRDTPEQFGATNSELNWRLQFRVSVLNRTEIPDSGIDDIVAEIHEKLMADPSLGGLVLDIEPAAAELQLIDADNGAGIVSSEFVALYRTQLQDLTA